MTFLVGDPANLDIWLWRLAFAIMSGLIPFLVRAYLCQPARTRMTKVREVVERTETALKKMEERRRQLVHMLAIRRWEGLQARRRQAALSTKTRISRPLRSL